LAPPEIKESVCSSSHHKTAVLRLWLCAYYPCQPHSADCVNGVLLLPLPASALQAVVWTDEELDALLDRTNLTSPGVADEEARSGILDGFQVAHFKLQERPGLEAAADAAARWQLQGGTAEEGADVADGGFGSADLQASKAFWSELLQGRQGTALQTEAAELFGKGKRQRQKLAEPGYAAELDEWLARQGSGDDSRRSSSSRSSSGECGTHCRCR
jgi:hypothetical protein